MSETQHEAQVFFSDKTDRRFSLSQAWADALVVFTRHTTWRALAYRDIRSKYRRTFLGPWWITMTNAMTAVIMGIVVGRYLGTSLDTYLPHFVVSMTIWNFISTSLNESCYTLVNSGGLIRTVNLPIIIHVMRMVQRNFISFIHNFAIVPVIWLIFPWRIGPEVLLAVGGIAIIYAFIVAASTILATICVRYRDMPPIVAAVLQILFFVSPIIWVPEATQGGKLLLALNPISYLLAVSRDSIMSRPVPIEDWFIVLSFVSATILVAAFLYSRYRRRVVFWT